MPISERSRARKTWIAGIAVLAAYLFALLLFNDRAYADITATRDEVHKEVTPPASVAVNQHQHDDDTGNPRGASAFNEEQDYTTRTLTPLDICIPGNPSLAQCEPNARAGRYDRPSDFPLRGGVIQPGTCIDSHIIHADPTGTGREVFDGQFSTCHTRQSSGFADTP